jgi:hypothetical protein
MMLSHARSDLRGDRGSLFRVEGMETQRVFGYKYKVVVHVGDASQATIARLFASWLCGDQEGHYRDFVALSEILKLGSIVAFVEPLRARKGL